MRQRSRFVIDLFTKNYDSPNFNTIIVLNPWLFFISSIKDQCKSKEKYKPGIQKTALDKDIKVSNSCYEHAINQTVLHK